MFKIEADLHTHTISSGHAYSTVDELARTARDRGVKLIAITDHGPNMPGGPHNYYFGNLEVIPEYLYGVRIIKGVEANILDQGRLDLDQDRLEKLDFVAAGIHASTGHNLASRSDYTRATIAAIKDPFVDMIAHPVNLKFPLDYKQVVKAAAEYGVILELNASSFKEKKIGRRGDYNMAIKMARYALDYGAIISLNTDSHFHQDVGDISTLDYVVQEVPLKKEDVLNTSLHKINDFLSGADKPARKII